MEKWQSLRKGKLATSRFEADVEFSEGTRSFGLRFYENEETSQSYQYLFNIEENRYRFEKSPNMPWPANQNIGLERPIRLEAGKKYHIQMILDDTIATIYVDGVALNTRFYQKFGQSLSLFVTDGTLTVTNAGLSKTIKSRKSILKKYSENHRAVKQAIKHQF